MDDAVLDFRFRARGTLDLATVGGLTAGLAMVVAAILLSGSPLAFINLPSTLIVLGGTACVTAVCFSPSEIKGAFQVALRSLFLSGRNPKHAAVTLIRLSEIARRKKVLALQPELPGLARDPFLHRGIAMVTDGIAAEEIEAVMGRELLALSARGRLTADVLRKAAEIAPAMGLIGTLIGLVQMLANIDDPTTIGPAMAVALLTTLYGALLAYMVLSPLASKVERVQAEEGLINQLSLLAMTSIARSENPRRLEMLLNSVLPPAKRVAYFR